MSYCDDKEQELKFQNDEMNLEEEKLQQSTWKLWGEEKTENAIYTVYLKKVRYHSVANTSDFNNEISHLEWETTCVKFIKAGTVEKLVDGLTSDNGELEPTYINIFFATYRTFATPEQVLHLVLERYEQLINNELDLPEIVTKQREKSIVVAIQIWLDSYPDDFSDLPLYISLHRLISFSRHYLANSDLLVKAKHRMHRVMTESSTNDYCSFPDTDAIYLDTNGANDTVYNFPDIPCKHFAEQLTRIDTELFKRLIPHQCLGAVWSRRDKSRSNEAATVVATVNQFNAVSFRVMSTILVDVNLKMAERAKLICTWIDIAQELRLLKNFSSLKAIISGLQSNPVYRLQKTWHTVAREKVEVFFELARIFSEENNQLAQRELLIKEGTAKFADTVSENDRHMQKVIQHQINNAGSISHGTIPYLGTFLTDLTMINTAIPDVLVDGLVNFDKKRKEFEVLVKIRLLQGAANAYHIETDVAFDRWFDSVLVLDDKEAYRLSCLIEPTNNTASNDVDSICSSSLSSPKNNRKQTFGLARKMELNNVSNSLNGTYFRGISSFTNTSPHKKATTMTTPYYSHQASCPSVVDSSSSVLFSPTTTADSSSPSHSGGSLYSSVCDMAISPRVNVVNAKNSSPYQSNTFPCDYYIIRVGLGIDLNGLNGTVLYKSIVVGSNERTQQVIRNCMVKLGIEGNPEDYTLAQILPDKEMVLPPNANVYYAVNTAYNLNFILQAKNSYSENSKPNTPLSKCKLKTHLFPSSS